MGRCAARSLGAVRREVGAVYQIRTEARAISRSLPVAFSLARPLLLPDRPWGTGGGERSVLSK